MLVSASKLLSNIITPYRHTPLPLSVLASKIHLIRCRASQSIRQKITSATDSSQVLENAEKQESAVQGTLDKAASLALSPKRLELEAWVALVNEYLPQSLRSTPNAGGDKPPTNTKDLPGLLSKARSTMPHQPDVLSYMGIQQGRWGAVRWLFQSLSRGYQPAFSFKAQKKAGMVIPWNVAEPNPYGVTSLDEITAIPISFDLKAVQSAEVSSFPTKIRLGFDPSTSRPKWLGQIWAMLAHMILGASEYPTDHANGQNIMSFVLETLAHLHHIDAVPRTIYTYPKTSDANESHKPPTLSLMASRILSELSDSAWKAQDEEIRMEGEAMGAKNWYKGHELPKPTFQPRVDKLGKEIWLDLILWCCVEGGYYTEAAWVVAEILKQKSPTPWRVIGWSEIRRLEEPKMNWSVRAELEIARSHLSRIGPGLSFIGPREVTPPVDVGPRTVSREVIITLIDGLANSLGPIAEVEPQIACCRDLLSQNRSLTPETNILTKAVLSIFTSRHADFEEAPEAAHRVLALIPIRDTSSESPDDSPQSKVLGGNYENEVPAAVLGLLDRTLYIHTIKGDIQAALRTIRKIQMIIDADRQRHIIEFAEDLKRAERTGEEDQLIGKSINNNIPSANLQISTHTLSAFLNLLTDAHLYDLGNWLLYSDEVDGPFLPPSLYSVPNVQSALLRFAIATKNSQLFNNICEKLQTPLAAANLRIILHRQITSGKWDAAEEVFRHFQLVPTLGWRDIDIMVVARSVLQLEKEGSQPESLARAQTLLQQLLFGEFNIPRDASQPWLVSDWRTLNQIYLMLHTVYSSSLRNLKRPEVTRNIRMNAPVDISSEAFDVLLEGTVETQGSLAGLKLWERWCGFLENGFAPRNDQYENRVKPTQETLRILMRPLVRQGRARSKEEEMLIERAVTRYKWLGFSNKEIEWELPGLYQRT